MKTVERTLYVEQLDAWSALYCLLKGPFYDSIHYVTMAPGAANLLPGSLRAKLFRVTHELDRSAVFPTKKYAYFVTERIFDEVYPPAQREWLYGIVSAAFGIDRRDKLDLYFKKLLYERLMVKIKTHYFLRRLVADPERRERLLFLPNGDASFGRWLARYEEYRATPVTDESAARFMAAEFPPEERPVETPRSWAAVYALRERLSAVAAATVYAPAAAWFVLRRAFALRRPKAAGKYALRWAGPLRWDSEKPNTIAHHFLWDGDLTGAGDYQKENLLLLLDPPELKPGDEERLRAGGYRYAFLRDASRAEPALVRVVLAALPRLWAGLTWRALTDAAASALAMQAAGKMFYTLARLEHEAARVDCRLYRETAEYSSDSILKTLVLNKRGVKTFNIPHGDHFVATEATCYLYLNLFFIWSQRQQDVFRRLWAPMDRLERLGPYKNDAFHQPLRPECRAPLDAAKGLFKVALFDTTFDPDLHITGPDIRRMYEETLDLVEELGVYLIIKSKLYNRGRIFSKPGFEEIGERVAGMKNVHVMEPNLQPQEAFKMADLALVFSFSTVGTESICCGLKTLYFDTTRLAEHPYRKYPGLVLNDKESLKKRLAELRDGGVYLEPEAWKAMIAYEGSQLPSYKGRFSETIARLAEGTP